MAAKLLLAAVALALAAGAAAQSAKAAAPVPAAGPDASGVVVQIFGDACVRTGTEFGRKNHWVSSLLGWAWRRSLDAATVRTQEAKN
jgi:hypothetical protein